MNISNIMLQDELTVFDKTSRKIREREGKCISINDNFLTIQFLYYKDSFLMSDLRQGKAIIFKNKEAVEFPSLS